MKAYQIRISLNDVRPKVWRQALIPEGITFSRLASMLNDIMGWMGGHMYAVNTQAGQFISGMPDDCVETMEDIKQLGFDIVPGQDGGTVEIDGIFQNIGRFSYTYDLGDEWMHTVVIEKTIDDYAFKCPQVLAGGGSCPPDDCGGPFVFMNLMENPEDYEEDERDMFMEEMEEFSLEETNGYLKSVYGREILRTWAEDMPPSRSFPDLRDGLSDYTMANMKEICKLLGLSGYSGLKKSELIEFLISGMTDPKVMERIFCGMTNDDMEIFEMLTRRPYYGMDLSEEAQTSAEEFQYYGYVFQTLGGYYFVPPEIIACYESLDTDALTSVRQRNTLIADYCRAAVNLYGIVESEKLEEIFNMQNEETLAAGELQHAATAASIRGDNLVQWQPGYIYDSNIDWDIFNLILEQQAGKAYYVPEREEFLRYADSYYCEKTLAWEAVQNFLIIELEQNRFTAELLCHEMQALVHIGADMESIFELMGEFHVPEPEDRQLFRLTGLVMDAWNCTRMVTNRGFTPNEMSNLGEKDLESEGVPDNVIQFPGERE